MSSKKSKSKTNKESSSKSKTVKVKEIDYTKIVDVRLHLSFLYGINEIYTEKILEINENSPGKTQEYFKKFTDYYKEKDPKKRIELTEDWQHEERILFTLFSISSVLTNAAEEQGAIFYVDKTADEEYLKKWAKAMNDGDRASTYDAAVSILETYKGGTIDNIPDTVYEKENKSS